MPDDSGERALVRRRLLGWGAVLGETAPGLDVGRDLVLAGGPGGVDLARVEGTDNLVQDLSLAFTTLLGSDVFNTAFGFDGLAALAEEQEPVLVWERLRVAVVRLLHQDPRVARIIDVNVADDRLQVPRAGLTDFDVRVRFETVTGDEVAVQLGRGGDDA